MVTAWCRLVGGTPGDSGRRAVSKSIDQPEVAGVGSLENKSPSRSKLKQLVAGGSFGVRPRQPRHRGLP